MKISLISFIVMCIAALLGGCNPFSPFKPDSGQIIESGWAKPALKTEAEDPLYCYETLGERVCYRKPRKGSENTLTGYYGPKPF